MSEPWHELSIDDVLKRLNTSKDGLSEEEAKKRLKTYGLNVLEKEREISRIKIFLNQFKSILVIVLIIATIFSMIIGEIIDAVVIITIVILNAVLGFFQEYKAEKTIQALEKLTTPEAIVIRSGKRIKVNSASVVPGDIVLLEQGSRVPADLRLIDCVELAIDESMITGESTPVYKNTKPTRSPILAERKNIAWMGTVVTSGRGVGVVIETGMRTEMGRIAKTIQKTTEEETPLQKKLDVFGKNLGMIIVVICIVVAVLGIIRGGPLSGKMITQDLLVNMTITGIALAVAAIPEGLPAVVTITLALGLQRLARHNALIRRLPVVETLGSTTVICADKTGTLTKNEMTVVKVWCWNVCYDVTGKGYDPKGNILLKGKPVKPKSLEDIVKVCVLCNNTSIERTKEGYEIVGDPTEAALLVFAEKYGVNTKSITKAYPRIKEIPFTSERKMMTTIHTHGSEYLVCTKGALERVLPLCTHIYVDGKIKTLTKSIRNRINEENKKLTENALRVLAIACKKTTSLKNKAEKGLVFLGLVGMLDPPREGVKESIELCKKAGIKVVMITGDHKNTAMAIAKKLGILSNGDHVVTGKELDEMSDNELKENIENISVYARVNPEHKVRIVDAFKSKNHIIAMTGDGVNDATALKKADIGIAMGIKGTDVAKEAADMILRDDNFRSIVMAVREGRGIYDNIKKFIQYLLSSNMGEVLIVFMAMLIGFTDPYTGSLIIPLTAIQLLWINLLTDGLPAVALGLDPPSSDIMERKPRDPKEKILSRDMLTDILIVGIIMCIGTLFLFAYNLPSGSVKATTIAFTTVVIFEMVRIQSIRMKFKTSIWSNKKLILAVALSIFLQLLVLYTPLRFMFKTTPIDFMDWLEIILVSLSVLIIMYIKQKVFSSR
ncbi:MAG: ATPase [Candidatus Aenigmatarchaeota archaeon]|nr:MAG: ATPase [Candidatus Aenigmarchaeota archaeon]